MNAKYARLANGQIEYAPDSVKTDDGVKVNPSAASYLAAGWKRVVDERPAALEGHSVAFSRYEETDDAITLVYKQVEDDPPPTVDAPSPVEPGHRTFSKLKLVTALKAADKWVLVKTWLEEKAYYDFYLAAQDFSEEHPLFAEGLAALKEYARLSDEEVETILAQCVAD